jgi:hypothetical protein
MGGRLPLRRRSYRYLLDREVLSVTSACVNSPQSSVPATGGNIDTSRVSDLRNRTVSSGSASVGMNF